MSERGCLRASEVQQIQHAQPGVGSTPQRADGVANDQPTSGARESVLNAQGFGCSGRQRERERENGRAIPTLFVT